MKYANNVKPGDIIITRIGTAVLLRETRAMWYYLYKDRVNGIKKSEFWRLVDIGEIQIKYVDSKKYRRKQKKHRIFDLRNGEDYATRLEEFLNTFDPSEFWVLTKDWGSNRKEDMNYFSECINELKYRGFACELDKRGPGLVYIKVTK